MPIYEPDRERMFLKTCKAVNPGPLPGRDLVRIYERIIDMMRKYPEGRNCPDTGSLGRRTENGIGVGCK